VQIENPIVFQSERVNAERRGLTGEFDFGAIVGGTVDRFVVDAACDIDEPPERGTVYP